MRFGRRAAVGLAFAVLLPIAGVARPTTIELGDGWLRDIASERAAGAGGGGNPRLEPFKGLGAWVDIYDDASWQDPPGTVARIAAQGVRTIYIQTTNYRSHGPINRPERMDEFLDAAATQGVQMVAWYVPDFEHMNRDFNWSMAAIEFESDQGNRFDAFGLDIEAREVANDQQRSNRVVKLSQRIREAAGPGYPLGAIVVPPIRSATYWPIFPDQQIADIYDVVLPMAYWAYHEQGARATYSYIVESIRLTRERSGQERVPIHLIGGVADDVNRVEAAAFVHAVREYGLIGASFYDEDTSGPEDWAALAQILPTPLQRPVMPFSIGEDTGAYGNIPGGDRTHPREVFFRTAGLSGAQTLVFEASRFQKGEVVLLVNWREVATLPAGKG
ncbi:MAG: hypothetical protein ACRDH6_10295, partial [Actinomycetota bacterium]